MNINQFGNHNLVEKWVTGVIQVTESTECTQWVTGMIQAFVAEVWSVMTMGRCGRVYVVGHNDDPGHRDDRMSTGSQVDRSYTMGHD
jgi:hypothetical protein